MRHSPPDSAGAQTTARENPSNVNANADTKRRRFLFALGAGSAGTVALGASKSAVACNDPPPADTAAGYRETEHVRDYYRTAKI
jgi:hypothetical protein